MIYLKMKNMHAGGKNGSQNEIEGSTFFNDRIG